MSDLLEKLHRNKVLTYSVLVLVPFVLYAKSIFYDFSPMDEQWLIIAPASFLEKWQSLLSVFNDSIQKVYYRPLFTWTLILDYHLGGLNPTVYHTSNILMHIISVLLLYRLLGLMNVKGPYSLFLALLFAVHPALLHAVAWVPGRNDSLLCIFTICSLIQFIRFRTSFNYRHAILHLFFFLLALFTKETAIMLPIVFIFLYFKYERRRASFLFLCFSWIILVAALIWMRSRVIETISLTSPDYFSSLKKFFISFVIGTGKAILPASLSVTPTISNSIPLVYTVIMVLFFVLVYKTGVRDKFNTVFGLFTFFILMAGPVWFGALTPLGEQYEHRAYTPMIGMMIFAGQLDFDLRRKRTGYALLIILILFAARSFTRMDVYKTPLTYLAEGIEDCPENYIFQSQMGHVLYIQKQYSAALPYFDISIAKQPAKAQLYASRGHIYTELGKKNEAISDYTKAIQLDPRKPQFYMARCMAFNKFSQFRNALSDLVFVKRNFPGMDLSSLESELKASLEDQKNKEIKNLNAAIYSNPSSASLYIQRAKYYFDQRMGHEALADLKKACELEPENQVYKGYYDKLNASFPR